VGKEVNGPPGQCQVTVSGNTLKFQGARAEEWYEATFTLKPNTSPKEAVFVITKCPFPQYVNKTSIAIYKIKGKTLTLAGNEPGSQSVPAGFQASADGATRLFVLSRTN
jgi:uncharacterized protein (TIGR03067 family)